MRKSRVLKHTNTFGRKEGKDEAKLETKKTRQKEVRAEGVKRRLSRSYGADDLKGEWVKDGCDAGQVAPSHLVATFDLNKKTHGHVPHPPLSLFFLP